MLLKDIAQLLLCEIKQQGVMLLVEGSYSCHPFLKDYYDLSVFLSVDAAEQIRRIRQRNGEAGAYEDLVYHWFIL